MAKKKNKRKKPKMPPLSLLDKTIYGMIALLGFVFAFLAMLMVGLYRGFWVFSDEQVVACEGSLSMYLAFPFMIYLLVTMGALYERGTFGRIPIFGKRGMKYGPPNWPPVYPIFMKNKPYRWVSENTKEMRKLSIKIWVIGFVICLALYSLSFFGRTCLMEDGRILQYNAFNMVTEEYLPGQMESVTFDTCKLSGTHSTRRLWIFHDSIWACEVRVTASDGATYSFSQRDFEDQWEALDELVQIKAQYPTEILRFEGMEHLERVAADHDYTEEERQILYALYAVPEADYPWYIR